jgi:glycosyltransferase involved in cell wall biosynthesis
MRIALVSPYHGGSHKAWAEGYRQHSAHDVRLYTLPARYWKWRMHGGAVTLARAFSADAGEPDLILATDMLDLTTFLALTRDKSLGVPVALYCHENQLTYPLPDDPSTGPMRRQLGQRDQHYAFINYVSALAADLVFFNSAFHRRSFLAALPLFLKHFPEYNELGTVAQIEAKSSVLPVGVDLARLAARPEESQRRPDPPLILWNQRWEYDKNPAGFFAALFALREAGVPFRLALCGQNYRRRPVEFKDAANRLADVLIHVGYAKERKYRELLWAADITVSTAFHEFFGISIIEAISCHTLPLLPRRLAYPEILPPVHHAACLYDGEDDLLARLQAALAEPAAQRTTVTELARAMQRFDWRQLAPAYDSAMSSVRELARGRRRA